MPKSWIERTAEALRLIPTLPEQVEEALPRLSQTELANFPPPERWSDWEEYDAKAWPRRRRRRYHLVPTTCFNCESACGLLAYVDKETGDLWIGTLGGLSQFSGGQFRNYTNLTSGLLNDIMYCAGNLSPQVWEANNASISPLHTHTRERKNRRKFNLPFHYTRTSGACVSL